MSRLLLLSSQIVLLLLSVRAIPEVSNYTKRDGHLVWSSNGVLLKVMDERQLNIGNLGLLTIQEDAFKNVSTKTLYLNSNQISMLKRGSFRGLPNLEYLFFDHNAVPLSGHLFAELRDLTWLTLTFNKIKSIPKDSFAGLSSLSILNLSYNNIQIIETESFSNVTPFMSLLYLNSNNISRIAPGSFTGLSNLNQLRLEHNLLESLPSGVFRGLNKLQYLFLGSNRIRNISRASLRDLVSLQELYLELNNINALEPDTFRDLSQLEILSLQGNKLSYIVVGTFAGLSNLKGLDLLGNNIRTVDNGTFADLNLRALNVDVINFIKLIIMDSSISNVIMAIMYCTFRGNMCIMMWRSENEYAHVD